MAEVGRCLNNKAKNMPNASVINAIVVRSTLSPITLTPIN
jgi:hypothetical protein